MSHTLILLCILLYPLFTLAGPAVHVLDDGGDGVPSNIFVAAESKGLTDDQGRLALSTDCAQTVSVRAEPTNPYFRPGVSICNPNDPVVTVKVTWKPVYTNLLMNQQLFLAQNDFASVALVSTELAARTVDPKEAAAAKLLVYSSMAKFLKIPEDKPAVLFFKEYPGPVASPELIQAVMEYQESIGIQPNGNIDYITLTKASKRTSAEVLFVRAVQK